MNPNKINQSELEGFFTYHSVIAPLVFDKKTNIFEEDDDF